LAQKTVRGRGADASVATVAKHHPHNQFFSPARGALAEAMRTAFSTRTNARDRKSIRVGGTHLGGGPAQGKGKRPVVVNLGQGMMTCGDPAGGFFFDFSEKT